MKLSTVFIKKITASVAVLTFLFTQSGISVGYAAESNLRQVSSAQAAGGALQRIKEELGLGKRTPAEAGAIGTPEEALKEFHRLYRENRVIILSDVKADYYGINSGRYSDEEVLTGLLPAQNIKQLLVDVANSDFMRRALNVVIDLKALTELLPRDYSGLTPEQKNSILEDTLPMARHRMQGTDGWRRDVVTKRSENPNVLCPDNLKEYAFAFGWGIRRLLNETGQIKEGERIEIVVGYDPRDPERLLTNAAIEGLQLAGVDVIDVGISATPATPIYMLYCGAHGAIEITASHNRGREPDDRFLGQNGTKLFLGFQGLKFFPEDELGADREEGEEMGLTALYYSVHGQNLSALAKKNGWKKGGFEDAGKEAQEMLERVMSEPINTWAMSPDGKPVEKPLDKNTMIVVDAAKGAYSGRGRSKDGIGIVARAFKRLGAYVEEPVQCRDLGDGAVNYKSGAGFIEGFHRRDIIERDDVESGELAGFPALERLFELGIENRNAIERDEKRVIGILLDADGDRYIRLDYDPWEDCLIISSGDEASYHQARYLVDSEKSPFRDAQGNPVFAGARFIFTVESDLSGVISAARDLKLSGDVRGVGDKWVLLQATLEYVAAYIEVVKEELGEKADNFKKDIKEIEDDLRSLGRKKPQEGQEVYISSSRIIEVSGKIDKLRQAAGIPQEAIDDQMCVPGRSRFAIGSEETGHAITMMVITTKAGRRVLVYFGNGFKSAVNDLVATTSLFPLGSSPADYLAFISHPFSRGHKENYYTYFTNRALLRRGSQVFNGLRDMWMKQIRESFAKKDRNVKVIEVVKPEELDMLFLEIRQKEKGEWKVIASAFCRNSGTEPKTTAYVRGRKEDGGILGEIVDTGRDYICLAMKDRNAPEVMAQVTMVRILSNKGPLSRDELIEQVIKENPNFESVDLQAVIEHSRDKEAIIEGTTPSSNPILELGPRGQWFRDSFAGAGGFQLTPDRKAAIERTVKAREALLQGNLTQPDIYGVTVKQNAAPRLITTINDEIVRGQIPVDSNGLFKHLVGQDISFSDVAFGYVHVVAPNLIVFVEHEGTLKGDLSGLLNLQKLTQRMITKTIATKRPDLSNEQIKTLSAYAMQRLQCFNIWTAGSGSREKEVAQESKATITLPNGNSFIANTIQQGAIFTDFGAVSLAEFIASWQPDHVAATEEEEGIVLQNGTDRIDLVTNPDIAKQIKASGRKYGMTMVGTVEELSRMTDELAQSLGWIVFNKETGQVVDFVEKPDLEELRARVPKGCGVASSWHLFGIAQRIMKQMEQQYVDLYAKHMDLSNDLQEAVLTRIIMPDGKIDRQQSLAAWMDKGTKNKRLASEGGNYTEDDWVGVWDAAQNLFPDGLGFVNSGKDSLFFDTGAVNTLFDLIKEFTRGTELGEILRRRYGVKLTNGAVVVNSNLGPNVKVEPGAVIVNTAVQSGTLAGVVTNVVVREANVDSGSWLTSICRPDGSVSAQNHQLVTQWYLQGRSQPVMAVSDVRESVKKAGKYEQPMFEGGLSLAQLADNLNVEARVRQDRRIRQHLPTATANAAGFFDLFKSVLPEGRRNLTQDGINELQARGCYADDWGEVYVSEGFKLVDIGPDVYFNGPVCLVGKIKNLSNVVIGNSVVEEKANIGEGSYIAYAHIGRNVTVTASTIRGVGSFCAKDNTPNTVTIGDDAQISASRIFTNDFRVSWQEYEGVLGYGRSEATPTIIRKGSRLSDTFVNNSEIREGVIASGSYLELCHIMANTWLYPGSRVVLSDVGGKIGADQVIYSYGSDFISPAQSDGSVSLNFPAAIALDKTTTPDGEEISYPVPVITMPSERGALTANWYGAGKAENPTAMDKGCIIVAPGVVLEPKAKVFAEKGHPAAGESLADIAKRDDMTNLGPLVEVVERGSVVGRVPAGTRVHGMSKMDWEIGIIFDEDPARVVKTVDTIQRTMQQRGEAWTDAHDQIVEAWLGDAIAMAQDMLNKERDEAKKAKLAEGLSRYRANQGKWNMTNGRFDAPELEAMRSVGGSLEEYVLGAAMPAPTAVGSAGQGRFSDDSKIAESDVMSQMGNRRWLIPKELTERGAGLVYGCVVMVAEDYDINNIEAGARFTGNVTLANNTKVRGAVINSTISGGVVEADAVVVDSLVINRAEDAISGNVNFSYVKNTSIPANAVVASSNIVRDTQGCDILDGEKQILIADSKLKDVNVHQGATLVKVSANTGRISRFTFPVEDIIASLRKANLPEGAFKAFELSVLLTFREPEDSIQVKKTVFGEGVFATNSEITNAEFGNGAKVNGAQVYNVIAAPKSDTRINVKLNNGYLGEGAVAGGSMSGFYLPAHAANGHSSSNLKNYYITDYVPGAIPKGSEIPGNFTTAYYSDAEGMVYGVFRVPKSSSNVGGGSYLDRFFGAETFTQINANSIMGDGSYVIAGLGAFISDMNDASPSNYVPACSYDGVRLGYDILDPGRIIFKAATSGTDYGRVVDGALRLEIINFGHIRAQLLEGKQQQPYTDAINLYSAVVDNNVFQTRVDEQGNTTFISPFYKVRVGGRSFWINDRLIAANQQLLVETGRGILPVGADITQLRAEAARRKAAEGVALVVEADPKIRAEMVQRIKPFGFKYVREAPDEQIALAEAEKIKANGDIIVAVITSAESGIIENVKGSVGEARIIVVSEPSETERVVREGL